MSGGGPGQALFAFVRYWSRRLPRQGTARWPNAAGFVLVAEAVHALARRGSAATVNAVAQEIGIDQSGASRLVKAATEAGYLAMRPSDADGRQRQATLTSSSRVLLDQAHDWQEQVFDRLTEGWSERRRRDFQQAMTELIERSGALRG